MRVLDLFSGLGGFSQPFRDRGHEVVTLDIDPGFNPDIVADIREIRYPSLSLEGDFDVALASPPCNEFSLPGLLRGFPRKHTHEATALVARTMLLVAHIRPTWWVMENPRAMLRKLIGKPDQSVYLCNFGNLSQKATDLWGHFPKLRNPWPCAPHEKAPRDLESKRSSRSGTLGLTDPAERAKMPYGLGEELCKRMEKA